MSTNAATSAWSGDDRPVVSARPLRQLSEDPYSRQAENHDDPAGSAIPSALRELMDDSDRRDSQLWFIVLVSLLVLTIGVVAIFVPNVAWGVETIQVDLRYLPQLISGLVVLIVLVNFYVVAQRRALRTTRLALLEQLARADDAVAESFVDPLTGTFNRRYMEMALAREVRRADRTDDAFSLLMIDVNDLGLINDRHGHVAGDQLLQRIAQVLQEVFRRSDTVVRYGGDEFLVILPDTNEAGSEIAVRRLSDRIATLNAANESDDLDLGVSCGIASYETGKRIEEVIELADHRMYLQKAKKAHCEDSLASR